MVSLMLSLALMLLVPQARSQAVDSTSAKGKNFAAFKTYAWDKGHEAYDPAAHKMIVAAIDKEMAALGFTRAEPAAADVLIRYHSLVSTVVDFKSLEKPPETTKDGTTKTSQLGTLVVEMLDPSRAQLWAAKTREIVDTKDPAAFNQAIGPVVARLFQTYPGRTVKSR
jgi:uncharacterized protein DUF4136